MQRWPWNRLLHYINQDSSLLCTLVYKLVVDNVLKVQEIANEIELCELSVTQETVSNYDNAIGGSDQNLVINDLAIVSMSIAGLIVQCEY